jgi:hypothetical protein
MLVAYIACGDILTGKQAAALEPSGSGHVEVTSPIWTGIAPSRYMHACVPARFGRQSGEVNRAALMLPVVPVISIAARFSIASGSPLSTKPEPLMSVNGAAVAIMYVEPGAAFAPRKVIERSGPPESPFCVPPSGSKLPATPPSVHSSFAAQPPSLPETRRRR